MNPWLIPGLDHRGAGLSHWNSQHLFQLSLALELGDISGSLVFCLDVNSALFCPEQPCSRAGTIKRLCGPIRSGGGLAVGAGTGHRGQALHGHTSGRGTANVDHVCGSEVQHARPALGQAKARSSILTLGAPAPGRGGQSRDRPLTGAWADGRAGGLPGQAGRVQGCVCHHSCQAPPHQGTQAHLLMSTHTHTHVHMLPHTHRTAGATLSPLSRHPPIKSALFHDLPFSAQKLDLGSMSGEMGGLWSRKKGV